MALQPYRVTPEMLDTMVELLPTVGSLRDLCGITGLRIDTVRLATAPFRAIMKLNGTHPKCGCGRDRFHRYGCADSVAKGQAGRAFPGRSYAAQPALAAKRAMVIQMLVDGDRFVDVDRAFGTHKTARRYLRFLTPDQLATRAARQAERGIAPAPKGGPA